jgi:DNA polymerase-3 subunit delta
MHGAGAQIGVEEVEEAVGGIAEREVWRFVDAAIARDRRRMFQLYAELRAQGEDVQRLLSSMALRVREVLIIAERLEAGETPADVKGSVPDAQQWRIGQRIKEARATDLQSLRRAVMALAALERATRGGSELQPDTEMTRTLLRIAA